MTRKALESLGQIIQSGHGPAIRLVRLTSLLSGHCYQASELTFHNGQWTVLADSSQTVRNIAESADQPGTLPANTDTIALDLQGQWVICVPPTSTAEGTFPARIIAANGSAHYTVREQDITVAEAFIDRPGATDVTATNLAELSLGPGQAVDLDTIVLIHLRTDAGDPPTIRYCFDHPCYATYLD